MIQLQRTGASAVIAVVISLLLVAFVMGNQSSHKDPVSLVSQATSVAVILTITAYVVLSLLGWPGKHETLDYGKPPTGKLKTLKHLRPGVRYAVVRKYIALGGKQQPDAHLVWQDPETHEVKICLRDPRGSKKSQWYLLTAREASRLISHSSGIPDEVVVATHDHDHTKSMLLVSADAPKGTFGVNPAPTAEQLADMRHAVDEMTAKAGILPRPGRVSEPEALQAGAQHPLLASDSAPLTT